MPSGCGDAGNVSNGKPIIFVSPCMWRAPIQIATCAQAPTRESCCMKQVADTSNSAPRRLARTSARQVTVGLETAANGARLKRPVRPIGALGSVARHRSRHSCVWMYWSAATRPLQAGSARMSATLIFEKMDQLAIASIGPKSLSVKAAIQQSSSVDERD